MPNPVVKIGEVTHPFQDIAQVVIELGISPRMLLPTAVEMFTKLDEVTRAGSLRWAEGIITLNLTNSFTTTVSVDLREKLNRVCLELLRIER